MGLQCQVNDKHVWKRTHKGKREREYPVAMVRRLVKGFVHDLRPPQLHVFVGSRSFVVRLSRIFCCVSCSKIMFRQLNVSVFES